MRRRHIMMTDDGWEAQKLRMRENTALALINHEYPHAFRVRCPELVIPLDPNSCPQFCPECHGENMTITPDGEAVECSRYRNRRERKIMMESQAEL